MNKIIKKIMGLSEILLQVGIVFIIIGIGFKILHTPGSEILVTIGSSFTFIFSVIAFLEIAYSERISLFSKIIWVIFIFTLNNLAVLVYFFRRLNLGYNTSSGRDKYKLA